MLPFRFDPILICLAMGCNRGRRVTHTRGCADQSGSHVRGYRGGVRQSHCCHDCVAGRHSHACFEGGPQPIRDLDGDPIHPVMSLEVQRLIAPPEPVTTALAPQLAQEGNVGEAFFVAQRSTDVFIDDGDDDESPGTESGPLKRREEAETRVTGWCNGDAMRVGGSMAVVTADTLGQMPHGRWRSCAAIGTSSGISYAEASPWTAQISRCNDGVNLGMTKFRPTASVYDGTGEELIWRLIALLEGTNTDTTTSDSGVVLHLVRNTRRVDVRAMLESIGLNVTNTNSTARYPLQSFVTRGITVATAPCHHDENDAVLVQLRGSKEVLVHEPTLAIPGCSASVYGDAAATDSIRWLRGLDPFQLPRRHSSQWIKVVLVPGDVVVIPKLWWHAVRSTPGSVAISVPVRLETLDGRTVRRRTCRRGAQPVPAVRGQLGSLPAGGQPSNSRRTDYSLGADDTIAYYYALTDTQLATDCQVEYERLDGRVITWRTGGNLLRFAGAAAAELGLGAQQTASLHAWMARFQLRPKQGGAVLTAGVEAEVHGEPNSREAQQADVREHEHWAHGRFRYHPADSYTNEGGAARLHPTVEFGRTAAFGRHDTLCSARRGERAAGLVHGARGR